MRFRNPIEHWIYQQITSGDEYDIAGLDLSDKVIIDVGSHVGFFSFLCLYKRAKKVYAFEIDADNVAYSKRNLKDYADKFIVERKAVWRSDVDSETRYFGSYPIWEGTTMQNTGGIGIVLENAGHNSVETISLDAVISKVLEQEGHIDLLKIDAESSEWPILLTSRLVSNIPIIVGEYHEVV